MQTTSASSGASGRDRIAIIAGLRTPFTKQGTALRAMRTVDLGTTVVKELLLRTGIAPRELTLCIYGQVVPTLDWLNIAREVVLRSGMPKGTDAFSVTRACATSLQALTSLGETILAGQHAAGIAGGADSMSDVPIGVSKRLAQAVQSAQKAKGLGARLKSFAGLAPRDLVPAVPGFSREPTTGETMGEAAEKMAKLNGITREEQDAIALASHLKAARAWAEGRYDAEVMHVIPPPYEGAVTRDNIVREGATLEALAKLPPVFDRRHGTITAGNASPLTDGASALIVMRESKAKALGLEPLGYLKSWAYAAVDPGWQLLMAPVFAMPRALDAAGLRLADIDVFEIHEAFAAQVASNLEAIASKRFAEEHLGRGEAIGEIDPAKMNLNGGSIAIGHPFAATGGRLVTTALHELKRRGKQHALVSVCAAGGLGAVLTLEAQ